jgi:hypothetical protein
MVAKPTPYAHLILLARHRTFHFNGPPPADIRSAKYLESRVPDEAISAVLAYAQEGDFTRFSRLIDLIKGSDDGVVWGDCAMLYARAAPFSALWDLINAFAQELYASDDVVTQQWISEILCSSGALWCVPEVLKIFRRNQEREKYFATPRYLSFLMEPERGEIADGPPVKPRTDNLPTWFDVPAVYDDDAYEDLVLSRYAALCGQIDEPARAAFSEGEPLTLTRVAEKALVRIFAGEDIEEIAIARTLLEAGTGQDLSEFYRDGLLQNLSAAAIVEDFLESGEAEKYEPGVRYFFGHRIPN